MQWIDPKVIDFLQQKIAQPPYMVQIEQQARLDKVPVVQTEVGNLLKLLVTMREPKAILEVGTAVGYSTLWMWLGLQPTGNITTIELDEERATQAEQNFQRTGAHIQITLLRGDAAEVLSSCDGPYDFCFLDAAKGQYLNMLKRILPKLSPRSLIVTDNVLFRGYTVGEDVPKRYRTIARNLSRYVDTITSHPDLHTTILPIGDGVSISVVK